MREIKFRAWDKKSKLMWNSAYIILDGFVNCYFPNGSDHSAGSYRRGEVKLMQYTGLKDKNGKEIYEKDIVKNKVENNIFVVEWRHTGFNLKFMENHDCEVIGNIYENKELLKR